MDEQTVKPQKIKLPKQKKNEVVENRGITGQGEDYTIYKMTSTQKLMAVMVGFVIGYAAAYIYFNNQNIGLIIGLIAAYKAIPIYQNKLLTDRQKELRLQFRDLLESLSNSYTVGMTSVRAFNVAWTDMATEHGKDAYITKEVGLICDAHEKQGYEIRDLLNDFSQRSGIDDIRSFAGVYDVSTNLGGDVGKVVRETRDMINDKVEVEMEIQTMVTGQKSQLNTLAIMPVVMALITRTFESDSPSTAVIVIKIIALGLFVFAYWLGTRIVDIKV